MGDKHEIGAVLFFKVASNQVFFFWLQIVWVFDLGSIFFGGKAFRLGQRSLPESSLLPEV